MDSFTFIGIEINEATMYVIVQSGEAVEIVQTPEGFKAKEWYHALRTRRALIG